MDWITINNGVVKHELYLRLVFFALTLAGLAFWESKKSLRVNFLSKRSRWTAHFMLGGLSYFLVRVSFPVLALSMAVVAEHQSLGLLHSSATMSQSPFFFKAVISLLGLDFALYMQHRWMHRYAIFWRVHRVHHTDTELDFTTGLRFHPMEYFFMMGIKLLAIVFLGTPLLAVFIFEVLFTSLTLFNHSNIQLPSAVEGYLRVLLVTPNMHRIHHSDIVFEHNRNFGFCFSIWDKIFNSYLAQAHQGERHLVLGLEVFRQPSFQTIQKLLALPFLKYKASKKRSLL